MAAGAGGKPRGIRNRLWLRADASPRLGLGHVMRTVAISEEARLRGWEVIAASFDPERIATRIYRRYNIPILSLRSASDRDWTKEIGCADAVVFDGYGFSLEDHASAEHAGCTVSLDDFGEGAFGVDVIVIPEPIATPQYRLPRKTLVKVGPKYAPIRSEFRLRRQRPKIEGNTLLIAAGGSDAGGITAAILESARRASLFERFRVLVGPAAAALSHATTDDVEVLRDPPSVPEVLEDVDAAITTAGNMTWELLCMGIPTAAIVIADNQRLLARALGETSALISLGTSPDESRVHEAVRALSDTRVRVALRERAMQLVDGRGAARILKVIEQRVSHVSQAIPR